MNNRKLIPYEVVPGDSVVWPPGHHEAVVASGRRDSAAAGLGRYLRAARLHRGFSHDELSRRAGLPQTTIILLELGIYQPDRIDSAWLERLAKALKKDVDDLKLLLDIPLPSPPSEGPSGRAATTVIYLPARSELPPASSSSPAHANSCCYFGSGLSNSRDRYRSTRTPRDPERQFFDK